MDMKCQSEDKQLEKDAGDSAIGQFSFGKKKYFEFLKIFWIV